MRSVFTRLRALIGIMALIAVPAVSSANSADSIIYSGSWGKLDVHDQKESDGPRVALALSGGASRGLAHIGVLRALDERGIRIAGIAGTSMGGIIGALYSAGYSPDSIEALARDIDFSSLFANSPRRRSLLLTQREEIDQTLVTVRFESFKPSIPTELSSAQRVTELLTMLTLRQNMAANRNFLKLNIPFSTVATDITRGESVTLSSGNLAEALRGTMAFPLAISGVEWGDRLLMDGGILKPAPVDVAREICGNNIPVLLVNATKELQKKDKIDDPFEVAQQVTTIMSMRELQEEIESADYLITPGLDEISTSDFGLVKAIVDSGYSAAQEVIQKILDDHSKQLNTTRFSISNCQTELSALPVKILCDSLKRLNKSVTISELKSTFAELYSRGSYMHLEVKAQLDSQDNDAVILHVEATPAPIAEIINVEVSGAEFIEPDTLREKIQSYIDSLRMLEVDSVKLFVESIYADRGLTLASVEDCHYNPGTSTLVIVVDEAIARWVNVYGNERTRFSYIRDRIDMQPGKPLSLKSIANTYRDLYTSGLFKRVTVDAEPTDSGVAVNVAVEEDNSLQMRFGYHWHDEYHSEGLVELEEMNSFGIGMRAGARGRLSERRKGAQVYLANDRLFRTYVAADMEAEYRELDRSLYDTDGEEIGRQSEIHRGVSFRLGQHLSRFGFVSGEVYVGRVKFSDDLGNQFSQYDSRLLRIRSVVDDLDRTYFPTSGRRTEIHFESAGRVLGGETEYTKWFGMLETYIPISRRLNFHPRISAITSSSALPSPERFYIGGLHSFPGFRTAELSGAKALLANFDLRYRIMGRIYLMGEYATGNTYEEDEEIRIDNVRHGWSAGVGIDLPIGPVYIMYGHASEGHERTYFQAGLEF